MRDGGLREVLDDLHARGVQEVLVEGGGEVLAAFVAEQLFERVSVCCAPLMLGGAGAPSPLGGPGRERLSGAPRLADLRVRRRGPDVILEGIRERCLPDLLSNVAG